MSDYYMLGKAYSKIVIFLLFATYLSACSNSDDKKPNHEEANANSSTFKSTQQDIPTSRKDKAPLPTTALFIKIIDEHFSELISNSKQLNEDLISFAKKPLQAGLQNTIKTLEKTHDLFVSAYFLDSCCFIYTQNLTKDESDLNLLSLKTRLDQQPLLPGYLDVVDGYPYSGLIYSDIPITRKNMEEEFQLGDPAYVTLGFHALELILKGSKLKRKVSDFSALASTKDTSTEPAELRRTLYALLLASEIEKDILALNTNWKENIKEQLLRQAKEKTKRFFLDLILKIEQELKASLSQQAAIEQETQANNRHINLEILLLKKILLEKLFELKDLQTET